MEKEISYVFRQPDFGRLAGDFASHCHADHDQPAQNRARFTGDRGVGVFGNGVVLLRNLKQGRRAGFQFAPHVVLSSPCIVLTGHGQGRNGRVACEY
jgi:hypothetical protein